MEIFLLWWSLVISDWLRFDHLVSSKVRSSRNYWSSVISGILIENWSPRVSGKVRSSWIYWNLVPSGRTNCDHLDLLKFGILGSRKVRFSSIYWNLVFSGRVKLDHLRLTKIWSSQKKLSNLNQLGLIEIWSSWVEQN